jgi:hypothetical protein
VILPGHASVPGDFPTPLYLQRFAQRGAELLASDGPVVRKNLVGATVIGTRKILYCNVTAHPTAEWTAQQFREAIPSDHGYHFLIHDRDSIFSSDVDQTIENSG